MNLSYIPSIVPSNRPSTVPPRSPSVIPSYMSSAGPTKSPTVSPTETPSVSPTYVPSSAPTCPPSESGKRGNGEGCKKPYVSPTAAPTICQDIPGRFPVNGVTQACGWVINGGGPDMGLPSRCDTYPIAKESCPFTCGDCGCLDSRGRFKVAGITDSKSCAWVARKQTRYRCSLDNVRFWCPATCGNCY